ncbi:MAG TPA: hypothetical protein PLW35_06510 [Verrucomicrobiota bacterium]|nr:hypothetical protein [Verrucomicrobiota bacterium]HOK77360.1 hypothetical protein [Verrucomicrobiota bacterium]
MSVMMHDPVTVQRTWPSRLRFRATDITESNDIEVEDLEWDVPAGDVAQTLAARMELPTNVPWALRNDQGMFLDDTQEIGAQIEQDARLTLTPKAHLG